MRATLAALFSLLLTGATQTYLERKRDFRVGAEYRASKRYLNKDKKF